MIELVQEFDVHPNQINPWRDQLPEGATCFFGDAVKSAPEPMTDVKAPDAKIAGSNAGGQFFVRHSPQAGFVACLR